MSKDRIADFIEQGRELASYLAGHKERLWDVLKRYETRKTFEDELGRAVGTLRNLREESDYLDASAGKVAVFLPINLPLYSYVLYCYVPQLMASELQARPPVLAREVFRDLARVIDPGSRFRITFHNSTRAHFIYRHVRGSQIVLFTGRFENACTLQELLPKETLFIFNGYGVNPFVIGEGADIESAVQRIVWARTYNSGQDCAGPDALLVHERVLGVFLERLGEAVAMLKVGDNENPATDIGPLTDSHTYAEALSYLKQREADIVASGVSGRDFQISPTVLLSEIQTMSPQRELFSPVFNVVTYRSDQQLHAYFSSPAYKHYSMYASVFGDVDCSILGESIVLRDQCVLDVDDGNRPFGGYGVGASHVRQAGQISPRPILISKVIKEYIERPD